MDVRRVQLLGVVWAAVFYCWFRDDPAEHPATNEAERRLITADAAATDAAQRASQIPWRIVLSSSNIWLLGTLQSCSSCLSYMFMGWYPTYLNRGGASTAEPAGWRRWCWPARRWAAWAAASSTTSWAGSRSYHPARFRIYGFVGTASSAVALVVSAMRRRRGPPACGRRWRYAPPSRSRPRSGP